MRANRVTVNSRLCRRYKEHEIYHSQHDCLYAQQQDYFAPQSCRKHFVMVPFSNSSQPLTRLHFLRRPFRIAITSFYILRNPPFLRQCKLGNKRLLVRSRHICAYRPRPPQVANAFRDNIAAAVGPKFGNANSSYNAGPESFRSASMEIHEKALPAFSPSFRNTMAAGQKPVNAA